MEETTNKKPRGRETVAKARRWVRRRIIIDSAFQIRMLGPILVFLLIFVVLTGAFAFLPLYSHAANDPNPSVRALLQEQLLNFHLRLWPMVFIATLVSCIYTLMRSNKVAGPLFKLKKGLMQMMVGEYQKIKFRKGDELKEFEDVANRLAVAIDSITASAQRKTSTVEKRLKFLKSRLEVRDLPKSEVLEELDNLIEQVGQVQVVGTGAAAKSEEVQ
ncbi:MAG: hypothetical protein ACM3NO_10010 [Deltaproteobacteria bacterium]